MTDYWLENNKCLKDKFSAGSSASASEGDCRAYFKIYASCSGGSKLAVYRIEGGGHAWRPGGKQYLPKLFIGKSSSVINASDLLADFFSLLKKKP